MTLTSDSSTPVTSTPAASATTLASTSSVTSSAWWTPAMTPTSPSTSFVAPSPSICAVSPATAMGLAPTCTVTTLPILDLLCPLNFLLEWTEEWLRQTDESDIQLPQNPDFPLTVLIGADDTQRHAYGLQALRRMRGRVQTSRCGFIFLRPLLVRGLQDWMTMRHCCRRCVILLEDLFPSNPSDEEFAQCLNVFSSLRSVTDRENLVILSISADLERLMCHRGHCDMFSPMQKWTLAPASPTLSVEHGKNPFPYMSKPEERRLNEYFCHAGTLTPRDQSMADLSLLSISKSTCSFHKVDDFLRTPARRACMQGNLTLVRNMLCCTNEDKKFEELVNHFWNKLSSEPDLDSILDKALETAQDPRVIKALLEHGASPHYRTRSGSNILQALFSHHLGTFSFPQLFPVVRHLKGFGYTVVNEKGENLLHLACAKKSLHFVEFLTRKCPELMFEEDENCRSPLMLAVQEDQPSLAEVLLEHLRDYCRNNEGPIDLQNHLNDLLLRASVIGSVKQVDFYLSHGADWKTTDESLMNALQIACKLGHTHLVERLLPTMVPLLNSSNLGDGKPLVMAASHHSHQTSVSLIKVLLSHGAEVNEEDWGFPSALHQACLEGNDLAAALLIRHGANVNAEDETSRTPLHNAAEEGHAKLVQLLVDHGATVDVEDIDGHTAQDMASLCCQWRVVSLLRHLRMHQGIEYLVTGADMARSF